MNYKYLIIGTIFWVALMATYLTSDQFKDFDGRGAQANLIGPVGSEVEGFYVDIAPSVNGLTHKLTFTARTDGAYPSGTVIDGLHIQVYIPSTYSPSNPQIVNNSAGSLFDPVVFVDLRNNTSDRASITFIDLDIVNDGPLYEFTFDTTSAISGTVMVAGEVLTRSQNVYQLGTQGVSFSTGGGGVDPPPPLVEPSMMNITAHPEKRLPKTGNWGTRGELKIYNVGKTTLVDSVAVPTNAQGTASVESPVAAGTYDVAYKGLSHLTKFIDNKAFVDGLDITLDYTFGGTFDLLAGDVALNKDDFVNSMDLAAMVLAMYSNNEHADLNADGMVNSLDLVTDVDNMYEEGELDNVPPINSVNTI